MGRKWPSFFFFFGRTKFTHTQYINLMLHDTADIRRLGDRCRISFGLCETFGPTCDRNAAADLDVELLSNLIRLTEFGRGRNASYDLGLSF